MSGEDGRVRVWRDEQGDHALRVQFSVKKQVQFFTLRNLRYTVCNITCVIIKRGGGWLYASVADPGHFGTDPYFWPMDPDLTPNPAISVSDCDLPDNTNKLFVFQDFLIITFCTFTSFFKDKKS